MQDQRSALLRNLDLPDIKGILQWRSNFDQWTAVATEEFEKALNLGDPESVKQQSESYRKELLTHGKEAAQLCPALIDMLAKKNGPLRNANPIEAIRLFPGFYWLLEIDIETATIHPLFGRMLVGLRLGAPDVSLHTICKDLLNSIGTKITQLPALAKAMQRSKSTTQHDISLERLLQEVALRGIRLEAMGNVLQICGPGRTLTLDLRMDLRSQRRAIMDAIISRQLNKSFRPDVPISVWMQFPLVNVSVLVALGLAAFDPDQLDEYPTALE